ncbi:MAG: EamA family transporter [Candidatus Saccharibacteria bacterium]|nr:EamA family transporter [Candidatus Saccharibacteria bacterium]
MFWLVLIAIYLVTDSAAMFIDNFVTDVHFKGRGSVAQKVFTGWSYTLFAVIMMAVLGAKIGEVSPWALFFLTLSGIIVSISSIAYYRALEIEDSTDIAIFFQLAPILYLVFGWFVLGEKFSPTQLIAFATILAGPLLIVAGSRKNSRKTKLRAVVLVAIYVLIYTIGNILFVKVNGGDAEIDFRVAMAFVFLGKGLGNLVLCYIIKPKWRKRFRRVVKESRGRVYFPLFVNSILCLVKDSTYRLALLTAPAVAIAAAAGDSLEPIVIFMMGIVLTLINPKLGREKLDRKTVVARLIATACVVIGIFVLQIEL